MPLNKQAKALYEAALRRKGLPLDKATVQHARDFIGPVQTYAGKRVSAAPNGSYFAVASYPEDFVDVQIPETYASGGGRYQDIYDELVEASNVGRYRTPGLASYQALNRNYWAIPAGKRYLERMPDTETMGRDYNDPAAYFYRPLGNENERSLTALGERELDALFEADLVEGYKRYLRGLYEGRVPRSRGYEVEYMIPNKVYRREPYSNFEDAYDALKRYRNKDGVNTQLFEKWPK